MTECLRLYGDDSNYLWLLKPTFLNRGRGIHVFSTLENLVSLINEYFNGYVERDLKKTDDKIIKKKVSKLP